MSKETRTFHIDGCDYNFHPAAFNRFFKTYQTREKMTVSDTERKIADSLHLSIDTVHGWRFGNSGPSDIETIKSLETILGIHNYLLLLNKKIEVQPMTTNDRILDSLKRIYDAVVFYLDDFDTSSGFTDYWTRLHYTGFDINMIESEMQEIASNKLHKVEIVFQQEYIILHKLDIYSELEKYIYEDLCNIWDGKLNYYCRIDGVDTIEKCITQEMSVHEEMTIALNQINEMMSEYF
jgi:hypothetical protein